jgi:hypothetical protein
MVLAPRGRRPARTPQSSLETPGDRRLTDPQQPFGVAVRDLLAVGGAEGGPLESLDSEL